MLLDGHVRLGVPVEELWWFLMDIHKFSACVPGLEEVTELDHSTFEGAIRVALGPMASKFTFRATMLDKIEPERFRVLIEGNDSITGSSIASDVGVVLRKVEDGSEMVYHANVEMEGRLAIIGDLVLRATAKVLFEEFGKRVRSQLQEG
jgi:carbon monoxide dehydrogenase subunit G